MELADTEAYRNNAAEGCVRRACAMPVRMPVELNSL
jgi:hypothetical protein